VSAWNKTDQRRQSPKIVFLLHACITRPFRITILLCESFREGSKVRTRTLPNLTAWAPERIAALRRALVAAFGTTDDDKLAVTVEEALAA
jgi:hypothetical protein